VPVGWRYGSPDFVDEAAYAVWVVRLAGDEDVEIIE